MMTRVRKPIAVLTALIMVLGILPMTLFSANADSVYGFTGANLALSMAQYTQSNPYTVSGNRADQYVDTGCYTATLTAGKTYIISAKCDLPWATGHNTSGTNPGTAAFWLYLRDSGGSIISYRFFDMTGDDAVFTAPSGTANTAQIRLQIYGDGSNTYTGHFWDIRIYDMDAVGTLTVNAGEGIESVYAAGLTNYLSKATYTAASPYTITGTANDDYRVLDVYTDVTMRAGESYTISARSNLPWATGHNTSGTNPNTVAVWLYFRNADGGVVDYHFFNMTGGSATFTVPSGSNNTAQLRLQAYGNGSATHTAKFWDISLTKTWDGNPAQSDKNVLTNPYTAASPYTLSGNTVDRYDYINSYSKYNLTPGDTYVIGAKCSAQWADAHRTDGSQPGKAGLWLLFTNSAGQNVTHYFFNLTGGGQTTFTVPSGANGKCQVRVQLYSNGSTNYTINFWDIFMLRPNDKPTSVTKTAAYNYPMAVGAEVKTGYHWGGWSGALTSSQQYFQFQMPSASAPVLTATALPNSYTVNFAGGGNDGGSTASLTAYYNADAVLPANAFTKTGYHFTHWLAENGSTYGDGATIRNLTTENGKSFTFTAQWEINTYAVTFSKNGTGYTNTTPASTVTHGESVSFTVTLSDGYTNSADPSVTATNGSVSSTKSGNTITYTVSNITGATTITVGAATLNTYTVKFVNSLTGEQIGADQTVAHGSAATAPAVDEYVQNDAAGHYKFTGWDKAFNNVTGDLTVNTVYETEAHSGGTATCNEYAECDFCGAEYGDYADHEYGEWIQQINKTCLEDGTLGHYTCSVCGKYFDAEHNELVSLTIAHEGHKPVKTEAKASTCTEKGNIEYYTCDDCGKIFTEEACEHEITAEQTVLDYDYTNHSTDERVTKNAKDAKCNKDGYTGDIYCAACDHEVTHGSVIPKESIAHTPVKTEEKAATCTEKGNIEYYTCSVCGKIFTEAACTNEITAEQTVLDFDYTNHSTDERVTKNAKDAKCNEDGYTGDIYCAACDHEVTHGSVIPMETIAHTPVKTDEKVSTCTEKGNIAYYTCSVCGKIFTEESCENEIAAENTVLDYDYTNHSTTETVVKDAKDATCNEDGYTGDIYCAACDHLIEEGETIPSGGTEHVFGEWYVKTAPGCTEEGVEARVCGNCGEEETRPIAATGHSFGEWIDDADNAPSCTKDGKQHRVCAKCGETETREVTASEKGHSIRLPNDEGEGYCAFCGEYRCLFCEKDEHMHETNDASVMTFFVHIVHIFYHMFSNFRYTLNHR